MKNTKQLSRAFIACTILCLTLPNLALGQQYYKEPTDQPTEESHNENTEKEESGGLPWWVWAIIICIGVNWLDNDGESQSTVSQPRRTTTQTSSRRNNPYVIDPSR